MAIKLKADPHWAAEGEEGVQTGSADKKCRLGVQTGSADRECRQGVQTGSADRVSHNSPPQTDHLQPAHISVVSDIWWAHANVFE